MDTWSLTDFQQLGRKFFNEMRINYQRKDKKITGVRLGGGGHLPCQLIVQCLNSVPDPRRGLVRY